MGSYGEAFFYERCDPVHTKPSTLKKVRGHYMCTLDPLGMYWLTNDNFSWSYLPCAVASAPRCTPRANNLKVLATSTWKSRPESGPDCITCATSGGSRPARWILNQSTAGARALHVHAGPPRHPPWVVQGFIAHKKHPSSLGPPQGPRHVPTVGSYGEAVSYERCDPVHTEP